MASLLIVLGQGRRLVAVTPEVRKNPWLSRVAPWTAEIKSPFGASTLVGLEELLRRDPTVVVLWQGNLEMKRSLESANVPVVEVAYSTPDEMKRAILALSNVFSPAPLPRAERFIRYYDYCLERVASGLRDLPESARPRVYYASTSTLLTEGNSSLVDSWIELAGARNAAARAGVQRNRLVSLEQVLGWDPEFIVTLDPQQRAQILSDSRWQHVSAVRRRHVYSCPKGVNAWCTRASETALQLLWAAKLFHPDRFASLDIEGELRGFYRAFYDYELSNDETARIMRGLPPPE